MKENPSLLPLSQKLTCTTVLPYLLSDWNLLYDEQTFKTKTPLQKTINFLLMACPFVHWISVILFILLHFEDTSLVMMGEDVAFSIGGLLVGIRLIKYNKQRSYVSQIVHELNLKNQELRRNPQFRQWSNLLLYGQILVFGLATALGSLIAVPQTLFAIYIGRPYYQNALPVDSTNYSTAFWIVCLFQAFTLTTSTFSSCLQECIVVDWFLQAYLHFRAINHRIVNLRQAELDEQLDEKEEYDKLVAVIKDIQEIEKYLRNFVEGVVFNISALFLE